MRNVFPCGVEILENVFLSEYLLISVNFFSNITFEAKRLTDLKKLEHNLDLPPN